MAATYWNGTASAQVKGGPGLLVGAVVSSSPTDAGVVTLRDGGATGAILATLRVAAGSTVVLCPALAVAFSQLYVKKEAGTTVEMTVFYV